MQESCSNRPNEFPCSKLNIAGNQRQYGSVTTLFSVPPKWRDTKLRGATAPRPGASESALVAQLQASMIPIFDVFFVTDVHLGLGPKRPSAGRDQENRSTDQRTTREITTLRATTARSDKYTRPGSYIIKIPLHCGGSPQLKRAGLHRKGGPSCCGCTKRATEGCT